MQRRHPVILAAASGGGNHDAPKPMTVGIVHTKIAALGRRKHYQCRLRLTGYSRW